MDTVWIVEKKYKNDCEDRQVFRSYETAQRCFLKKVNGLLLDALTNASKGDDGLWLELSDTCPEIESFEEGEEKDQYITTGDWEFLLESYKVE